MADLSETVFVQSPTRHGDTHTAHRHTHIHTLKCDSKLVFILRHHSFRPVIFIRSLCQIFPKDDRLRDLLEGIEITCSRMENTKWTQQNNLDSERGERSCMTECRPPLGYEKGAIQNWLRSSCSMEFANDDDDIYDSEHRLK